MWLSASLMEWKVAKSLYEKYGGRVGGGNMGTYVAFDGQNALIREYQLTGDIKLIHDGTELAFQEHTKIERFAEGHLSKEYIKELFATTPYMLQTKDKLPAKAGAKRR